MLATTEEVEVRVIVPEGKGMTTKDLLMHGDLPDEDNEDADFVDATMDDDDDEDDVESVDSEDGDAINNKGESARALDEEDEDDEITAEEVNDLNAELAHMQSAKVLRSGFKAEGNYRDMTILDNIDHDEADDDDYLDADDVDEDGEESDDDEDVDEQVADGEEIDEEEVRAIVINAANLPTKQGKVLRDGKEIPGAESDIDLVARMQ
ncbi:hypothetical protein HK100_010727, partial [Physocladia obscura]